MSERSTKEQAQEAAEVEELKEMFKSSPETKRKTKKKAPMRPFEPSSSWNDSPMRPAPWALRGLKTVREPWAEDAMVYNKKFGSLHDAKFGPSNQASASHMLGRNMREVPRADGSLWDSSTFKNAPWPLRGLKPVTREPWYHDAAIYNSKFINDPLEAAGSSGVMDDGAFIDGTLGFTDNVHYDKDGTALTMREERLHKNWDSSTWRYTPHVLKGIRPVTKEPWARDEVVYHESRNSVDFRGAGDLSSFEAIGYNGDADDAPLWDATRHPPEGAMRAYPA